MKRSKPREFIAQSKLSDMCRIYIFIARSSIGHSEFLLQKRPTSTSEIGLLPRSFAMSEIQGEDYKLRAAVLRARGTPDYFSCRIRRFSDGSVVFSS